MITKLEKKVKCFSISSNINCYNINMNQNKLSLFVITKNSANTLEKCLNSVQGLADEIVIVDSFSEDNTLDIAQKYEAKIFNHKFVSFQEQKQFALEKCSSKWVLNLDADEELSPLLKTEIEEIINNKVKEKLFFIPEQVTFLNRKMKYSGLTGKYHERLALREGTKYIGGAVHEKLFNKGPKKYLKGCFYHTPYTSIEQYFEKFNRYTTLGAQKLFDEGKKFKLFNLFRQPVDFIKIYFIRCGFLDGMQGFLWAWLSSTYPTVKYAKLWLLERKNK